MKTLVNHCPAIHCLLLLGVFSPLALGQADVPRALQETLPKGGECLQGPPEA